MEQQVHFDQLPNTEKVKFITACVDHDVPPYFFEVKAIEKYEGDIQIDRRMQVKHTKTSKQIEYPAMPKHKWTEEFARDLALKVFG